MTTKLFSQLYSRNSPIINNHHIFLALGLIYAVVAFALTLLVPVNPQVGRFLKYGHLGISLCLMLFLLPAYMRQGLLGDAWSLTLTLVLFALPLSWLWQNDANDFGVISGLLPLSDASIYTFNALRLFEGWRFTFVSSFRPLFTGFLSVILSLTGRNLQITLAILTLIVAISCYLFAREVCKTNGAASAVIVLTVLFLYFRIYIGKALTESLGFALTGLAFALLWRGAYHRNVRLFLGGLATFSLAMNVRAGAFFAILTMLAWGAWYYYTRKRDLIRYLGAGILAIGFGFIGNMIVLKTVAAANVSGFGNFSMTLYGVVSGYRGYRAIYIDHPSSSTNEIYRYVLEIIVKEPKTFLTGLFKAYIDFFNPASRNIFSFMNLHVKEGQDLYLGVPGAQGQREYWVLFLIAGIGIVYCLTHWRDWQSSFILAGLAGILLSVPMLPPIDAGMRPYATTIPFLALLLSQGATALLKPLGMIGKRTQAMEPGYSNLTIWLIIILSILTIFGPVIIKLTASPSPNPIPLACPDDSVALYVYTNKGFYINLIKNNDGTKSRRPSVRREDFKENMRNEIYQNFQKIMDLPAGKSIIFTFNLLTPEDDRPIFLIIDTQVLSFGNEPIQLCASEILKTRSGTFYSARSLWEKQNRENAVHNTDLPPLPLELLSLLVYGMVGFAFAESAFSVFKNLLAGCDTN